MTKTLTKPIQWNLAQLWNEVAFRENRLLAPRDYIYASEVGAPFVDRFYKMKATPYTNPPNNRSLRKFLAGNIWEHVVRQILLATGVFKQMEVKVDATPYKNCLAVHGRLDFKAGGYINGVDAIENLATLQLPDFLLRIAHKIIESLHGGTLEEKILELKAVSTFAMDMVERRNCAIPQHSLQAYHYQKNGNIKAEVCYVCKDDCRMAQFGLDVEVTERLYREDIKKMTGYFKRNEIPPPEPLVKFDGVQAKFGKNLGVEYSPYLTKVYGFKTPDDYRKAINYVEKWNRTLARAALVETGCKTPTGKPIEITSKNKEVMVEIANAGYSFWDLVKLKVELGQIEEEEIIEA